MLEKPIITEKWQKRNKYGRPGTPLNYSKIAIHYTGQAEVPGKNTVSYFNNVVANGYKVNGKYIYASAHYVIDLDGTIYQLIPITERCYCTNSANAYAVAIEVATTGADNHYTDETYKSMAHLCAWLCANKGLDPLRDIITHTDVVGKSYKLCPIYMVKNPDKMEQFKKDCNLLKLKKVEVNQIVNCTDGKGKVTTVANNASKKQYVKVLCNELNIHKTADFNSSSICGIVCKGDVYTMVEEVKVEGCTTYMYKLKSGVYITASTKYVEVFEK
nr:MAG TPA: N-acetylmuramoyl-L-alanine amidase [Caudoviricetes sp.]